MCAYEFTSFRTLLNQTLKHLVVGIVAHPLFLEMGQTFNKPVCSAWLSFSSFIIFLLPLLPLFGVLWAIYSVFYLSHHWMHLIRTPPLWTPARLAATCASRLPLPNTAYHCGPLRQVIYLDKWVEAEWNWKHTGDGLIRSLHLSPSLLLQF